MNANLSIYPDSIALKKGDAVGFIVHLESKDAVNTIGTEIQLPPNTTYLSSSWGNVVTQWIEEPTYSAGTHSVALSGVMLNGWQGDGTVATIRVAAKEDGVYSLSLNKAETQLYKNDGKGTLEPVVFGPAPVPFLGPRDTAILGLILVVLLLAGMWARRRYKITFV